MRNESEELSADPRVWQTRMGVPGISISQGTFLRSDSSASWKTEVICGLNRFIGTQGSIMMEKHFEITAALAVRAD